MGSNRRGFRQVQVAYFVALILSGALLSASCQEHESGGTSPPDSPQSKSYPESNQKSNTDNQNTNRTDVVPGNKQVQADLNHTESSLHVLTPAELKSRQRVQQLHEAALNTKQDNTGSGTIEILLDGFSTDFVDSAKIEAIGCWFNNTAQANIYQLFAGRTGSLVSIDGRPIRLRTQASARALGYGVFDTYTNSAEQLEIKIDFTENKTRTSSESFTAPAILTVVLREKKQLLEGLIYCGV